MTSEAGQTLVEAIVAIAIAVVIVTALVTLGIGTQRAANTSRNQNQNTRYGEETIELLRSIRDLKKDNSIRSTSMSAFSCSSTNTCKFSDLFSTTNPSPMQGTDTSGGYYFTLSDGPVTGGCVLGTVDCYQLTRDTTGTFQAIPGTTIYTRRIRIYDSGTPVTVTPTPATPIDPSNKVKFVEVIIRWTDAAGNHDSVTTTKFTNFK